MILGIDQGLKNIGFCVIDKKENIILLDYLETKNIDGNPQERLKTIQQHLDYIFSKYKDITNVFTEMLFADGKEKTSGVMLSQLTTGVIYTKCNEHGKELLRLTPSRVKSKIAGNGKADKEDMLKALLPTYPILELYNDHVVDSLAIALTGLRLNEDS